jgi:hypothetical protein
MSRISIHLSGNLSNIGAVGHGPHIDGHSLLTCWWHYTRYRKSG